MSAEKSGVCSGGPKLVFACSGAADVGEIADRAARNMTKNGNGSMFCLAGIGGKIPGIIKKTQAASKVLAIDGCELDCVKSCLQEAGFAGFEHFRVTDLGMQKGQAAINDEHVARVVQHGATLLT
jgi:uncharacterized metal-binding protein